MNRRRGSGFTLIELVVTLAILALLAGMAAPLAETLVRRDKERELKRALYEMRDAIDRYKLYADAGYIDKPAGSSGYPPNLTVLVEGVRDKRSARGEAFYFLRRIPRDPFAAELDVQRHWGLRASTSSVEDPREGDDVFDVYSLARGVGLNGIAYREW
ncbi:type II secretion system protein [Halopseudomonas phragmitis]|uniref:General secretion pathway protein GspG n=2 Tax=Pseudomonadaceae TaxID=135621 RepID=A0A1V0B6G6_9GAMM|nr:MULTISPECIES: type II secretion system protein [Pseudomonadaceae]AQZ95515.1 general secretion pathway protein GspG [Halopseudomonas phragmitis]RHW22526.1 type II secretion system protein [Pseudomonas jilinensis]